MPPSTIQLSRKERKHRKASGHDCWWDGRHWYTDDEDIGDKSKNPREDKRCWLWNLLRQITMGGTTYYDQQREASFHRLRYWAFVNRKPENKGFSKGSPGGSYFSSTIGLYLAEQSVMFGKTKVHETQELVNIFDEWHRIPPYATFWAEVQEAYLYFLTQPRNKKGYEGNERAEMLEQDLRVKALAYDRRQGTDGPSQSLAESQVTSSTQGGTSITNMKATDQLVELPPSDFLSLFGYSLYPSGQNNSRTSRRGESCHPSEQPEIDHTSDTGSFFEMISPFISMGRQCHAYILTAD
jgi:hypothetical protein